MSDEKRDVTAGVEHVGPSNSVLTFLHERTGKMHSVSLHDEDSGTVGAPLIDPSSEEKRALPRGRSTYQLLGEIARGGMGVILKGHDTDLGRDVAMKVLNKELAGHPEVVQRFVEEAQIGGQLQHPGIVPVYELGLMADERPYFTMKLVKGRTLASLLLERETPAANRRRLIDVFESICQTMAYAHSRGVIHRDLKPANIMVGAFGEVQVVDWGLAKVLARGGTADERKARVAQTNVTILETVRSDGSGSGTDSMVGSVMGTPAYMPPEQASGLVDRLDERSDVFSLGAILCEILTGLPPYTGERSKIIADAAQAEYGEALERLDACGADPELVKLAKHCLVAAPAARPSNAGVVAERVHGHVVSVEERAHAAQVEAAEARVREEEARVHVQQERKARKLTLALAASVLGMALVGGGGWLFVQNERAAADRALAARQQEDALRERALAADVNEALNEASLLQGGERWSEAFLAAERARSLAEGGGASEGLRASVAAVIEDLRGKESLARRRAELARDNQRMLDELHEVYEPDWTTEFAADWSGTSRQYAEIFRQHGLEIDGEDVATSAAALTARGIGSEIALVFDVWAEIRRAANDQAGALRLLELAHLVDPDPLRADLREALENEEPEVLRWIADSGFENQPPLTLDLLASSLNRLGDRTTALQVYRAAARFFPSDFSLQLGLARLLTPPRDQKGDLRELQEALGSYRAAIALRPSSVVAHFHLGRVLDKLAEYPSAAEQYSDALALRPDDGLLHHRLGRSLQWAGEGDRALAELRRTIELGNGEWWEGWSHAAIAEILTSRGDFEAAIAEYDRAILVLPGVTKFRIDSGALRMELGDVAAVLQEMRRAVRDFPASMEARNNLAWYLATAKGSNEHDYAEALQHALRVVEMAPDANSFNTLGVARYMSGDLEGALADLQRSLELAKDDEVSVLVMDWTFLAMARHRLGDATAARDAYERAAALIRDSKITDRELLRFFADAAVLLGIEEDE